MLRACYKEEVSRYAMGETAVPHFSCPKHGGDAIISTVQSQEKARRPGPRRFTEAVRIDAEARLKDDWTPDIIGNRARLEGRPWVCKETIYKHIYADAKAGRTLWKNVTPL